MEPSDGSIIAHVDPDDGEPPDFELPPGDHPLEIAARRGIGPLSPLARQVWHGSAVPCVTCGQLVLRDTPRCEHCQQDLSPEMVARMRAHAGPWYVLEHIRPFPGVSLERVVRQIRRGLITETSILRGPATDFQWRFAVETPGLCRYFSRCWHCHAKVTPSAAQCHACLSNLSFHPSDSMPSSPPAAASAPRPPLSAPRSSPAPCMDSLRDLSAALHQVDLPRREPIGDAPPRLAGVPVAWVAGALILVGLLVLLGLTSARRASPPPLQPALDAVVAPS